MACAHELSHDSFACLRRPDEVIAAVAIYIWDSNGGKNTQDKIFLLSYAEVKVYLGEEALSRSDIRLFAVPTDYAIGKGVWRTVETFYSDIEYYSSWWLRSPGVRQNTAAIIDRWLACCDVNDDTSTVVRPALWLDLDADIF